MPLTEPRFLGFGFEVKVLKVKRYRWMADGLCRPAGNWAVKDWEWGRQCPSSHQGLPAGEVGGQ